MTTSTDFDKHKENRMHPTRYMVDTPTGWKSASIIRVTTAAMENPAKNPRWFTDIVLGISNTGYRIVWDLRYQSWRLLLNHVTLSLIPTNAYLIYNTIDSGKIQILIHPHENLPSYYVQYDSKKHGDWKFPDQFA
jgi:hypothetical protein